MATEQLDAIIIGAGHNGLVAAGYLARAGKKVVVLELRDRVGGACTLEEPFPGFTMSPCAYVVSLLRPEIIRDLELARYGFEAYVKDPQMFVPYQDGNYLFFRASTEQTVENIRRFSPHDAEVYPKFLQFFDRASEILKPILLEEPPSIADLAGRFRGEDEGIYRYLMFGNLYDMLADYFESDYLRAAFAGQGVIGTFIGPRTPGSVYVMWHHMFGEVNGEKGMWGLCTRRYGAHQLCSGGLSGGAGRDDPHQRARRTPARAQWSRRRGAPGEWRRDTRQGGPL